MKSNWMGGTVHWNVDFLKISREFTNVFYENSGKLLWRLIIVALLILRKSYELLCLTYGVHAQYYRIQVLICLLLLPGCITPHVLSFITPCCGLIVQAEGWRKIEVHFSMGNANINIMALNIIKYIFSIWLIIIVGSYIICKILQSQLM